SKTKLMITLPRIYWMKSHDVKSVFSILNFFAMNKCSNSFFPINTAPCLRVPRQLCAYAVFRSNDNFFRRIAVAIPEHENLNRNRKAECNDGNHYVKHFVFAVFLCKKIKCIVQHSHWNNRYERNE